MSAPIRPSCCCPVSQLATRPLDWLWPGRLALGKLAILDGDPGLGKSLLTLDLCARLSTGRSFPDGAPGPGVENAVVLNGEDGEEDTIGPRLQVLDADLSRVFVLPRTHGSTEDSLYLPKHLTVLDEALRHTRARLLIIDPIVAFLEPNVVDSSSQSVRRALTPLARLAEKHACAVLLVRHLNKGRSSRALYRGSGSIGYLGACRSGWLIAREPNDSGRCVLAQVKNNLAPPQPSLAYQVTPRATGPPSLSWHGQTDWTADQLLANTAAALPSPQRDRARDFLVYFLADGPHTSREVWKAACELNLSERTLERAKRALGIRSVWVNKDGHPVSYWLLSHQSMEGTQPLNDRASDLEQWLAPLREQYPPSTPLDEL